MDNDLPKIIFEIHGSIATRIHQRDLVARGIKLNASTLSRTYWLCIGKLLTIIIGQLAWFVEACQHVQRIVLHPYFATGFGVVYRYDEQGRIDQKIGIDAEGLERVLERREYQDDSLLPVRTIEPSVRPDENRIRAFNYDSQGNTISITESGWSPVVDDESRFNINNTAINSVERWQAIERTITKRYDDQSRLVSIDGPRDDCLLYTSPSPRDKRQSRMPSSA